MSLVPSQSIKNIPLTTPRSLLNIDIVNTTISYIQASSSNVTAISDIPNNPTPTTSSNNIDNMTQGTTTGDSPDHWLELPKMDNIVDIFAICCSTAVIFGGLVPYIPQYLKIKKSINSDGFSTYVCLTLLIANILRIMFWFGHRFELPLLIQSFVMIFGMLAMMELCIRVKSKTTSYTISAIGVGPSQRRRFLNVLYSSASSSASPDTFSSCSYHSYQQQSHPPGAFVPGEEELKSEAFEAATSISSGSEIKACSTERCSIENGSLSSSQLCQTSLLEQPTHRTIKWPHGEFWDWDDYFSYVKFLSFFTTIICLITYLMHRNYLYTETLGFVAVFTESMLGMPQLLRNYAKKSTKGMSVEMVVMWLSGDLFKTLYFILRHAPAQFYVCGSIQVIVDILILGQVLLYKGPSVTYRKIPKST